MPYYHQPGLTFTPVLLGAPPGVQVALGLRLIDVETGIAELTVAAGAGSGVAEINPPSGNYRLPGVAVPSTAGTYLIQWDHGAVEMVDSEQLIVSVAVPPSAHHREPGQTFTPVLRGAPSGVQAALGLKLIDAVTGVTTTTIVAGAGSGVVEINPPSGNYRLPGVAVPAAGTYLVQWDHGTTEIIDSEQLIVSGSVPTVEAGGMVPTVAEVGTLLRARTRDDAGNELGTFTADTRPTGSQVEALITQALADVRMRVGARVPSDLETVARFVVALRTAQEIESSYQPEQADDNTGYTNFRFQFAEQIDKLVIACQLRQVFSENAAQTIGASPYTYHNLNGYTEEVVVQGGAVSEIATSSVGVTFSATGETHGTFTVADDDYLRVTFTAAPAIYKRRPVYA